MWKQTRVLGLLAPVSLTGRTILVIGATAGVGAATAQQIAEMSATLIIVGRDPTKLETARQALAAVAQGVVHAHLADLADLTTVRAAAAALSEKFNHIDVVIANAGMLPGKARMTTKDGFESAFGINHLGTAAFLLGLEKPIRSAPNARVVIVASESHRRAGGLPLDDLNAEREFSAHRAYSRSKLCNILFAKELAKHWPDVRVYSAHPGGVRTAMTQQAAQRNFVAGILIRLADGLLISPEDAANGIVRVALDATETAPSGAYFEVGRLSPESALANDAALASELWSATLLLLQRGAP